MYKSYSELGNQPEKNRDLYSVLELSTNEQKAQIIGSTHIVCVDIYANWCGPCKQTESAYSILAERYNKEGYCLLVKENFQSNLTDNIGGLPTYQFFVNGNFTEQVVGADLQAVENVLLKYMKNDGSPYINTSQGPPNFNRNGIRNYKNPIENNQIQNAYKYPDQSYNSTSGAMYQSYSMNNQRN
jgi:thioredoxin 1